ncbi:SDR family NAD(P)-dependent oxidoreductase [Actinoplanes sp. CA-030573]|uniref:SDR family NAD(P)-dependent oxidoreductase n=1 Tax=Actinoplanes sp. CA-030573 TaxID=3239898 RepID=UPI003D8A9CFE
MAPTAVVTGSGSGLGRHIASLLAGNGYRVVIADVDGRAAEACARAIGPAARAVAADVREPGDLDRIVTAACELGDPSVLVNNAGGWSPRRQYPEAPADEWTATLALNLTAPMRLGQLMLEPMRAAGGGAIVNIASSAGVGAEPYGSPEYGAAKAGLIRFTTSAAGLARSHGVRVMCVVPGWIGLDRAHAEQARMDPADRLPLIPPSEIAGVVLDLVRRGASGTVVEMLEP